MVFSQSLPFMTIRENISLKSYNTFGVSIFSRYFSEVDNIEDLYEILSFAKKEKQKILILAGGSNVLFTKDFDGIVIALQLKGILEEKKENGKILVKAKAGENWHEFVMFCLNKNYGGIENLSLIPGNVGTSPIQNIGAYGVEIKDIFHSCEVLNLDTGKMERLYLKDCQFGYRDSIFKNSAKNKYVITEVCFELTTEKHKLQTSYGAIKNELEKKGIVNPSIRDISNVVVSIRQSKLPDPSITGNAGSFFKNPIISTEEYSKIKNIIHDISIYSEGNMLKIPAGRLIEECGWKGKTIGNVGCYRDQSLVIINATGNASGKEIYEFSSKIIDSVQEKFQIKLEREVNIL